VSTKFCSYIQTVQPGFSDTFSDEILYNAKIHPEQYSNTLSAAQVKQLHKSIQYICNFAVDHLSDSSTFPEEWLFKHRWGKGKKDKSTTLPNGAKFVYLKVGGRTSCVVPSVQKKTGPVAKDVDEGDDEDQDLEEEEEEEEEKPEPKAGKKASKTKKENVDESAAEPAKKSSRGKKSGTKQEEESAEKLAVANNEEDKPVTKANQSKKRKAKSEMKVEDDSKTEDPKAREEGSKPASKKRKSSVKAKADDQDTTPKKQKKGKADVNGTKEEASKESVGRRRSGRVSGKGV